MGIIPNVMMTLVNLNEGRIHVPIAVTCREKLEYIVTVNAMIEAHLLSSC